MTNCSKFLSKIDLDLFDILKLATGGLIGFSLLYLSKIWWSYRFFKKFNSIKTPNYRFFYGNLSDIIAKGRSNTLREWTKSYGKTYGYFEGHLPIMVTSDIEIINEIFIKKFGLFSARRLGPTQFSDNQSDLDIFRASKEVWKRMRTLISPTFSNPKLKELFPLMSICSNRLIQVIESGLDKELNVSNILDRLTMDTIFNCAFGIDIDPQKNPNNLFLTEGIRFFTERAEYTFYQRILVYFYEFKPIILPTSSLIAGVLQKIVPNYMDAWFSLIYKINSILDKRNSEKVYKQDYAQMLIDSYSNQLNENKSNGALDFGKLKLQKKLLFSEIKANLVIFLLAGFETTSSCLQYCLYILAKNKSEQENLINEIDSHFSNSLTELNFEKVQELKYLDMFVKEVLRFYPIANGAITRRCIYPTKIKDMDIPYNMDIAVDVLSLHFSEEHWDNPNEFNPLRFSQEMKINPLVYMPFGIGPRLCVGMKFALLEVKLTLVKILSKFIVEPSLNTPDELFFAENVVRRPKHGIPVIFTKRIS